MKGVWPVYPQDFKFFNQKKIETFKANCAEIINKMNVKIQNNLQSKINNNSNIK
jgi:hypothetical protein